MLNDVSVVKDYILKVINSMFKHPLAYGNADEIEGIFLSYLELLHLIDHPECKERCGWNAVVSYSSGKYDRSCNLSGCLRFEYPESGIREIVNLLMVDLKEIWDHFQETHPIDFTFCGVKVGDSKTEKS